MDLVKCPACGDSVSSSAQQCPHCGHPIAGRKTESTTGISAIIVIIGVGLSGWLMFQFAYSMKSTELAIGLSLLPTIGAFIFASTLKK